MSGRLDGSRADPNKRLVVAGVVLGLGLGGFVDGIVLHQILQWHHMLSSAGYPPDTLANLKVDTLADGLFHAATWLLTITGLYLLWRAIEHTSAAWSTATLTGALLVGWGLFDVVEGIVDHEILGVHHVNETVARAEWIWWDLGFLAFGLLLLLAGWFLLRAGRADAAELRRRWTPEHRRA